MQQFLEKLSPSIPPTISVSSEEVNNVSSKISKIWVRYQNHNPIRVDVSDIEEPIVDDLVERIATRIKSISNFQDQVTLIWEGKSLKVDEYIFPSTFEGNSAANPIYCDSSI